MTLLSAPFLGMLEITLPNPVVLLIRKLRRRGSDLDKVTKVVKSVKQQS